MLTWLIQYLEAPSARKTADLVVLLLYGTLSLRLDNALSPHPAHAWCELIHTVAQYLSNTTHPLPVT